MSIGSRPGFDEVVFLAITARTSGEGQTLSFGAMPKVSFGIQLKSSGLHLKETPDPEKNFGVHGGSDAAGLRVLLARVIDGE